MTAVIEYACNKASPAELVQHLLCCDSNFTPPLSARLEIIDYSKKISSKATRFEAWAGNWLVGLVAAYCNDHKTHVVYITSVSVLKERMGEGIAAYLMTKCVENARALGMRQISLEVASDNIPAVNLYKKIGFVTENTNGLFVIMRMYLKNGEGHEQPTRL